MGSKNVDVEGKVLICGDFVQFKDGSWRSALRRSVADFQPELPHADLPSSEAGPGGLDLRVAGFGRSQSVATFQCARRGEPGAPRRSRGRDRASGDTARGGPSRFLPVVGESQIEQANRFSRPRTALLSASGWPAALLLELLGTP